VDETERRGLGLLAALVLLVSAALLAPAAPAGAQVEEWELVERGANYVRRHKVGTNVYSWESAPQWVWNGSAYVPIIYNDMYATDGYYEVRSGLIGARIYDYYATFFDPNMTEVRLYDERWEVQEFKNNKWNDIGAQSGSPVFSISQAETCVNITKSFHSWAGWLNVTYTFREGAPLKHTVVFRSELAGEETFRVVQRWAGIAAAKVKHMKGEDVVTTTMTINSPWFRFEKANGSLSVYENQWDMYYGVNETTGGVYVFENENLKPVEIDVHAQGLKADFVFGNWTLASGESLVVDPNTFTNDDPTEDGYVEYDGGEYTFTKVIDTDYLRMGESSPLFWYGYIEWDISGIPDGVDVSDSDFYYHGQRYEEPTQIFAMEHKPSTSAASTVFNDASNGTCYFDRIDFPVVGENQHLDLGGTVDADIENQLTVDWFAIGFSNWQWVSGDNNHIYCKEYASATPPPKLVVTYSVNNPPNAPTLNSPSANTRYDISESVGFSWTFSDPDSGDSQSAYRFQLDDSSSFSSPNIDTGKVSSSSTSTTRTLPSTVEKYYWRVKTWDQDNAEGAWSLGRAIIADRIKVSSLTSNDGRRNIGSTATLTVGLVYEYDGSAITSGSFTLNGLTLTHQGGGSWAATDSKGTVQAVTYNTVSGSVGNLNSVNMNGKSTTVIWDRIHATATSVSDSRVNVGDGVNVDWTLKYDYDETPVTDGSVAIEGISATHQGSGIWRITPSKGAVQAVTYDEFTASGNTYGITAVDPAGHSETVIWDRAHATGVSVADGRINVGAAGQLDLTLKYDYDETPVTDGSVTIGGESATHQGSGMWRITPTKSTVQKVTYGSSVTLSGNSYGITAYDQNGKSGSIIWDQIEIVSVSFDDSRVNVGASAEARYVLRYDYDDAAFTGADGSVAGFTWDSANSWWDKAITAPASPSADLYDENDLGAITDNNYGLTAVEDDPGASIIGDRIEIYYEAVDDPRVDVGANTEFRVKARLEYDDHPLGSGDSLTANFGVLSWDSANSWFDGARTQGTVGNYTFTVSSGSEATYGITVVYVGVSNPTGVWDKVNIDGFDAVDGRISVGDTAQFTVSGFYEYDGTAWSGTYALNDTASKSAVGRYSYEIQSITDSNYGLTAFVQTAPDAAVIFDRIKLTGLSASDTRLDVGSNTEIRATAVLEYDSHPLGSGDSLTIGSLSLTWDAGDGRFEGLESKPAVQSKTYNSATGSEATYGITAVNMNGLSTTVIWDRLELHWAGANDTRINVGALAEIRFKVRYDYDDVAFNSGDGSLSIGGTSATWDGANGYWKAAKIHPSSVTLTTWDLDDLSFTDNTYGLTAKTGAASISVITDRVNVTALWSSDTFVGAGTPVTLYAETELEYDGHPPDGDDALEISGVAFTWDWGNERWYAQVTRETGGIVTYDTFTSGNEATYGITAGVCSLSVTVEWTDYEYTFHGLYGENGTRTGAVNVTVYLPSEVATIEVDGNRTELWSEKPEAFAFNLPGGGTRYIYIHGGGGEVYLFAPDGDYAVYSFEVRDYTGAAEALYLESLRSVNGTKMMVERMKVYETINQVPLTLTQSRIYTLQARLPDGSVYRFGDFIPGVQETPVLAITEIGFSGQAQLPSRYVAVEAVRPDPGLVRVNYRDDLNQTTLVVVTVKLMNGTAVWSDSSAGPVLQFNWWGAVDGADYVVWVAVDHAGLGELSYSWALAGAAPGFQSPPDLGVFGEWPVSATGALAAFLIFVVAGAFSAVSAPVGIFAAAATAAILAYLGWLDVSYTVLGVTVAMAVILGVIMGGRR